VVNFMYLLRLMKFKGVYINYQLVVSYV